jgi:3-methyladenine DNA glycosylase AlkD
MDTADRIKEELSAAADEKKAGVYERFFKTGSGEYGEGDRFLGVTVPSQRKIARKYYKEASLTDLDALLESGIHEHRLTALLTLVLKYEKAHGEDEKKAAVDLYLQKLDRVNNWDLVDSSAPKVLGAWLFDRDRSILYELANSENLWRQRVAVLATLFFIKLDDFTDTLRISERLLGHPHDLIHKAVGWMLREIGNREKNTEETFLQKHYQDMPRTMLRYAIEKFEPEERRRYLEGKV